MSKKKEQQYKPKLPRKRKKAAIKAQGRDWYYQTIKLWYASQDNPLLYEPRCKFWVNESVKPVPMVFPTGAVYMQFVPTRCW